MRIRKADQPGCVRAMKNAAIRITIRRTVANGIPIVRIAMNAFTVCTSKKLRAMSRKIVTTKYSQLRAHTSPPSQ